MASRTERSCRPGLSRNSQNMSNGHRVSCPPDEQETPVCREAAVSAWPPAREGPPRQCCKATSRCRLALHLPPRGHGDPRPEQARAVAATYRPSGPRNGPSISSASQASVPRIRPTSGGYGPEAAPTPNEPAWSAGVFPFCREARQGFGRSPGRASVSQWRRGHERKRLA